MTVVRGKIRSARNTVSSARNRKRHFLQRDRLAGLVKVKRNLLSESARSADRLSHEHYEKIQLDRFLNELVGEPRPSSVHPGSRNSQFDLCVCDSGLLTLENNNQSENVHPNLGEIEVVAQFLHDKLGGTWIYLQDTHQMVCVEGGEGS